MKEFGADEAHASHRQVVTVERQRCTKYARSSQLSSLLSSELVGALPKAPFRAFLDAR